MHRLCITVLALVAVRQFGLHARHELFTDDRGSAAVGSLIWRGPIRLSVPYINRVMWEHHFGAATVPSTEPVCPARCTGARRDCPPSFPCTATRGLGPLAASMIPGLQTLTGLLRGAGFWVTGGLGPSFIRYLVWDSSGHTQEDPLGYIQGPLGGWTGYVPVRTPNPGATGNQKPRKL